VEVFVFVRLVPVPVDVPLEPEDPVRVPLVPAALVPALFLLVVVLATLPLLDVPPVPLEPPVVWRMVLSLLVDPAEVPEV
jgi:hypothetical protein